MSLKGLMQNIKDRNYIHVSSQKRLSSQPRGQSQPTIIGQLNIANKQSIISHPRASSTTRVSKESSPVRAQHGYRYRPSKSSMRNSRVDALGDRTNLQTVEITKSKGFLVNYL